ncbi:uncharacterized protein LOC106176947 [Lingula anatina]|uniref:Uncharacterized protein LOC106176947 n=1 Tax=Lingula anatina TaxID=7574 RepID=A0A1S3JX33_LINAN|nr:uncharacterized protein LOC106176947 [Lingula anatina]|eukprot:XP_013414990.1 uncharacterized protein LOC106176947 [Lingula anatina]
MLLKAVPILVLFLCGACLALDTWSWANHGKPPVYTEMAYMKSGWSDKVFGVGNGKLQERYWSTSSWSWIWANHGAPWGLLSNEYLAGPPCVMKDGRVYIISNKGRLFERYWSTGSNTWLWAIHGKPFGWVTLRYSGCACTSGGGGVARVFAVGTNSRLYEHYWSWSSNAWVWRDHGTPPGTSIGPAAIATCNLATCSTQVFVVGANRYLYSLYITSANPGVATWYYRGKPTGEYVHGVSVGPAGVFVTTYDNDICEYRSSNWYCHGKPSGSLSTPSTTISGAFPVDQCAQISDTPSSTRMIFINSWDPGYIKRSRIYSLKVKNTNNGQWRYHGTIGSCCYYVGAPELFLSGTCPKAFFTQSNGYVRELWVH